MDKFVRNLITEWRRLDLPVDGDEIVIAVSGGADSVALLLAFVDLKKRKKLSSRLIAAHFNHGLRADESDADELFVQKLAETLGVEFATENGAILKTGNLEQNARVARYSFLHKVAAENNALTVVTGHTLNDQAETFLINLIRGSGIDGLSSMPVIRPLDDENSGTFQISNLRSQISELKPQIELVRPLLRWGKRSDTEDYCRENSIEFRNDAMNDDVSFKRVRIRKELIPMLETMNPKIVETLAATADLMRHSGEILRIHTPTPSELIIEELRQMSESEAVNEIRNWLIAKRGSSRQLTVKHIMAVKRLAFSEKSGRYGELPSGGRVTRGGGKLVYTEN